MKNEYSDLEFSELLENIEKFHPADIADKLRKINKKDPDQFYESLHKIPEEFLGDVLLELPEALRDRAYKSLSNLQMGIAIELKLVQCMKPHQYLEKNNIAEKQVIFSSALPHLSSSLILTL